MKRYAVVRASLEEFDVTKSSRMVAYLLEVPPVDVLCAVKGTGGVFAKGLEEAQALEIVHSLGLLGVEVECVEEEQLELPEEKRAVEICVVGETVNINLRNGEGIEVELKDILFASAFLMPYVVTIIKKGRRRPGRLLERKKGEEEFEKRMRTVIELFTSQTRYRFEEVEYDAELDQIVPLEGERVRRLAEVIADREEVNFNRGVIELASQEEKVLQFPGWKAYERYCEWLWFLTKRGVRLKGQR